MRNPAMMHAVTRAISRANGFQLVCSCGKKIAAPSRAEARVAFRDHACPVVPLSELMEKYGTRDA